MKKIRVLVVNDDGIDALGITTLVEALSNSAEVYVAAPVKQHSAKSHSITFLHEVGIEKREMPVFRDTRRWLDEYFAGHDPGFMPNYRIEGLTPFRQAVIDEMKGIYVPYWLFGGKANARMWFDATRVRHWNEGEYMCTETSYYKVFRSGSVRFADVPVDASGKIDDLLTESIEPFDIKEAKEFSENYLAGYYADKYSISVEESRQKANSRIANSTTSLFASTTRMYDSCAPSSSSISISDGRQDYVMYPVWLLNIKYGSKLYTFAMNGQTGKFVGELPIDRGKLGRIAISVFLGVTAAMTALQYLLYLVR